MARRSLLSISFQIHQSHYRVPSKLLTHSAFSHIDKQVYIDATFILAARNYYNTNAYAYNIGIPYNTTLTPAHTAGDFATRILVLLRCSSHVKW